MLKLTPSPAIASEPKTLVLDGFALSERADRTLASLSCRLGQEKLLAKKASAFLGADLPDISRVTETGGLRSFWTGPDQWFIEAPIDTHEDLETLLKQAVGDAASVTDQTGGWVRFDVSGSATTSAFEKLCMVDLAALPAGCVQRTVIEHIGCFVLTSNEGLSIWTPRSYAGSAFHAIEVAALSV